MGDSKIDSSWQNAFTDACKQCFREKLTVGTPSSGIVVKAGKFLCTLVCPNDQQWKGFVEMFEQNSDNSAILVSSPVEMRVEGVSVQYRLYKYLGKHQIGSAGQAFVQGTVNGRVIACSFKRTVTLVRGQSGPAF